MAALSTGGVACRRTTHHWWTAQPLAHHTDAPCHSTLAAGEPAHSFQACADDIECVHGRWPAYFNDVCVSVGTIAGRALLRSADLYDIVTPRVRTVRFRQRIGL